MMKMQALASGSNGNAIYIGDGDCHILVDAGISCKRIRDGLKLLGVDPGDLSAVLITHEHSDHIQGLKVLSKKYHVPVCGTRKTLEYIAMNDHDHEIDMSLYHPVEAGKTFEAGNFRILPVSTFHDAADPVCYRIENSRQAFAVVTDTGMVSEEMILRMQELDGILLEANHDIRMLEAGSYPFPLKRRILGDYGHLSNERAGLFLTQILSKRLKFCLLGHLSEENNYPELALMAVKNEIDLSDIPFRSEDLRIDVATRYESSAVYTVTEDEAGRGE